jgi:hypothetical protein
MIEQLSEHLAAWFGPGSDQRAGAVLLAYAAGRLTFDLGRSLLWLCGPSQAVRLRHEVQRQLEKHLDTHHALPPAAPEPEPPLRDHVQELLYAVEHAPAMVTTCPDDANEAVYLTAAGVGVCDAGRVFNGQGNTIHFDLTDRERRLVSDAVERRAERLRGEESRAALARLSAARGAMQASQPYDLGEGDE